MILLKRILEWIRKFMSEVLEKPVKGNELVAVYSAQLGTTRDAVVPPLGTSVTQTDYVDTGLSGGSYLLLAMMHFGDFDEYDLWNGISHSYISGYGSGGDGARIGYWTYYYLDNVNGQMRVVYNYTRWSPYSGLSDTHFEGTVIKLRGN